MKKLITLTKRVLSLDEGDETQALRRVVIKRDSDLPNPREEWDNVCTIYSECKYLSSDKGASNPVADYGESADEAKFNDGIAALPVFAHVHSGMTVSLSQFNDPWDSGCAGWIYVDKAKFCKEYGLKRFSYRRFRKVAEGEIKTLDMYINNEVFGYEVQHRATVDDDWEFEDSCWGFFGKDYIGEMVFNAGGFDEGVIVCEDDDVSTKGEVKATVLEEYANPRGDAA